MWYGRRVELREWNSQAKDSEQYETVASGWRQRLLGVFAVFAPICWSFSGRWNWFGSRFDRPPAIPGQHRAVGPVRIPEGRQLHRARRLGQRERPAETDPHAEIAGRPYVEAAQREDQEHVGRPRTDAANLCQRRGHGFVWQPTEIRQVERPGLDTLGEIDDRRGLGGGEAGRVQTSGAVAQTAAGVNDGPTPATNRRQIVSAAAPANCCDTIALANVSKR